MKPPPGYSDKYSQGEGCRLKRALYGLKQSPRAWFGRFSAAMKRFGYKQSNLDHTLFLKRSGNQITCLVIYVDDMVITGNDSKEIDRLRSKLFQEFEMKDLGQLKYFLGIEVLRSREGIFINQRKYILDLLAEAGIFYSKNDNLDLIGYTDADWAGDREDRKSTSGYFTLVGGNLVTWKSKKQKVVALSSAEAEFRGIAKGVTEILWIRKLLGELGFHQTQANLLYCDNKAAISISENPVQHDRTKHVEIDRHFIKEKLESRKQGHPSLLY